MMMIMTMAVMARAEAAEPSVEFSICVCNTKQCKHTRHCGGSPAASDNLLKPVGSTSLCPGLSLTLCCAHQTSDALLVLDMFV